MTANHVAGSAPAGPLIAIASGKGGVGKTWFAATLAHALARQGRRVLLFDGDLGLANVDIQLGLTPARDLSALLAGQATLAQCVLHHDGGGFDILAGRSGSGALATLDPASLERALGALRQAAPRYDAVLLDLGAGLERGVRRMSAYADTLLVLATDEPTSLTDAYAVLKLHAADRPGGDRRVVVNQAAPAPRRAYLCHPASGVRHLSRRLAAACRGDSPRRAGARGDSPAGTAADAASHLRCRCRRGAALSDPSLTTSLQNVIPLAFGRGRAHHWRPARLGDAALRARGGSAG